MGWNIMADGQGCKMRVRIHVKRGKNRLERRRARRDPQCPPGYGRYSGYLT